MTHERRLIVGLMVGAALAFCAPAAMADWTTYHADGARTGVDTSSGAAVPFAPAWSVPGLSGTVWAEPLVFSGLVIVATENNDLYAFNAVTGATVWRVNLGAPVPSSALPCGDITPGVGITSTPVIDPQTGILYALADLRAGSSAGHTLFAYNARTGALVFSRSAEPPSDPLNQLQRPGLALEIPRHGRRVTLTVHLSGCRELRPRHHRPTRRHRAGRHPRR